MRSIQRALACVAAILAGASQVHAGFLSLDYTTATVGPGQFQYDFKLTVTNQDSSFTAGQKVDWIIFGDVPFPGPSPLTGFTLISESFPSPTMNLSSSAGGHNGPTWIDSPGNPTKGWLPIGVGDFVTWSGLASVNLTSGLRFSTLANSGVNTNFELATYLGDATPTPEPASMALLAMGGGLLAFGRKRLSRRCQLADAVA